MDSVRSGQAHLGIIKLHQEVIIISLLLYNHVAIINLLLLAHVLQASQKHVSLYDFLYYSIMSDSKK